MITVFHVSDLHFGWPAVPEQIDAIEQIIQTEEVRRRRDLGRPLTAREGRRVPARRRLHPDARKVSKVIVVPGNHDVKWWKAPLGFRHKPSVYENYRRFIDKNLEPVLNVPGATFVGINTAHGVTMRTLTWNLRDISIIGDIHKKQLDLAGDIFAKSPRGDARVIVMHHNPVRGELSQRHGLKNTHKILGAFAQNGRGFSVLWSRPSGIGSLHRAHAEGNGDLDSGDGIQQIRGGRPSSVNVIGIGAETIDVTTHVWSNDLHTFVDGPHKSFKRSEYVAAE